MKLIKVSINLENYKYFFNIYRDTKTKSEGQYQDEHTKTVSSKWLEKLSDESPLKYTTNDLLTKSKTKKFKPLKSFKSENIYKLPIITM